MRLTIGQKLGLGFGSVLLLMICSSIWVYWALAKIDEASDLANQQAIPAVNACDNLLIAINRTTSTTRAMLLLGQDSKFSADFDEDLKASMVDVKSAIDQLHTPFKGTVNRPGEVLYQRILALASDFVKTQQALREATQAAWKTESKDVKHVVELMETTTVPKAVEIRQAAEELKNISIEQMNSAQQDVTNSRERAATVLQYSTILAVVLAAIISVTLTRSLMSSVRQLLNGVQAVAQWDLTQRELITKSSDEIGELTAGFNKMLVSLRTVLSETSAATSEVSVASGQISTGAQQQLASLSETSTSLNEITTSAEEFKATMQEFADRAKAVHEAADETARRASEGIALSKDSAGRIERVRENAVSAGESVLQLAEQMQRIGEITASVNEIAEQTKLLALNASIEAARAGEEGRGFAVVAMQVRELANQSKEAAGRIESLITQTQKSMRNVVGKIEEGGRLSEDSTGMVRTVASAFEEIARAIDQTRQAMAQINTGARQQERGISDLVTSIVEIDSASKEAVASAEQTQKAIVSIDGRLRKLNSLTSRFKT